MGSAVTRSVRNSDVAEVNRNDDFYHPVLAGGSARRQGEETVELFVLRILSCGDKIHVITSLLQNDISKRYFIEFLKQQLTNKAKFIDSWQIIEDEIFSNSRIQDKHYNNAYHEYHRLKEKAIKELRAFRENLQTIFHFENNHYDCVESNDEIRITEKLNLESRSDEDKNIALIIFMNISSSSQCRQWKAELRANSAAMSAEILSVADVDLATKSDKTIISSVDLPVSKIFGSIFSMELRSIVCCSSWLPYLVTAVESLPISFSLASASQDRPGFPLIYVNKYFERMTGYDRCEIIGKNCKFLQGNQKPCELQRQNIGKIRQTLHEEKQLTPTLLTNYKKDGTSFVNMLTMKPIFDQYNECRFVIGIQHELPYTNLIEVVNMRPYVSETYLMLSTKLLELLPDQIVMDSE